MGLPQWPRCSPAPRGSLRSLVPQSLAQRRSLHLWHHCSKSQSRSPSSAQRSDRYRSSSLHCHSSTSDTGHHHLGTSWGIPRVDPDLRTGLQKGIPRISTDWRVPGAGLLPCTIAPRHGGEVSWKTQQSRLGHQDHTPIPQHLGGCVALSQVSTDSAIEITKEGKCLQHLPGPKGNGQLIGMASSLEPVGVPHGTGALFVLLLSETVRGATDR